MRLLTTPGLFASTQRYANAHYSRGLAHQKKGENAKAEEDFSQAEALGYKAKPGPKTLGGVPVVLGGIVLILVTVAGSVVYCVHRTLRGRSDKDPNESIIYE